MSAVVKPLQPCRQPSLTSVTIRRISEVQGMFREICWLAHHVGPFENGTLERNLILYTRTIYSSEKENTNGGLMITLEPTPSIIDRDMVSDAAQSIYIAAAKRGSISNPTTTLSLEKSIQDN